MSSTYQPCPICKSPTSYQGQSNDPDLTKVVCFQCGLYRYTFEADFEYFQEGLNDAERAKLLSWIYHNQEADILPDIIEDILKLPTPSVPERAEALLQVLGRRFPVVGAVIRGHISSLRSNDPNWNWLYPASYSSNPDELSFFIKDYLDEEMGYLGLTDMNEVYFITPKGWSHLGEMNRSNRNSKQGFVAMPFSKDRKFVYDEGIHMAISQSGYSPLIMRNHEHTNRIDDEVMVQIRRSKFVVADLTLKNDGAYFEAGFALGLGIPVIWVCKKGEKTHFDTRQYNTIFYEDIKISELVPKLMNRILNVVGEPN